MLGHVLNNEVHASGGACTLTHTHTHNGLWHNSSYSKTKYT